MKTLFFGLLAAMLLMPFSTLAQYRSENGGVICTAKQFTDAQLDNLSQAQITVKAKTQVNVIVRIQDDDAHFKLPFYRDNYWKSYKQIWLDKQPEGTETLLLEVAMSNTDRRPWNDRFQVAATPVLKNRIAGDVEMYVKDMFKAHIQHENKGAYEALLFCLRQFESYLKAERVVWFTKVDATFKAGVDNDKLNITYTYKQPANTTLTHLRLEVYKPNEETPCFIQNGLELKENGTFAWDGKMNQGADNGKFIKEFTQINNEGNTTKKPFTLRLRGGNNENFNDRVFTYDTLSRVADHVNQWLENPVFHKNVVINKGGYATKFDYFVAMADDIKDAISAQSGNPQVTWTNYDNEILKYYTQKISEHTWLGKQIRVHDNYWVLLQEIQTEIHQPVAAGGYGAGYTLPAGYSMGGFTIRQQNKNKKLSNHSFGVAVDIDYKHNPQIYKGNLGVIGMFINTQIVNIQNHPVESMKQMHNTYIAIPNFATKLTKMKEGSQKVDSYNATKSTAASKVIKWPQLPAFLDSCNAFYTQVTALATAINGATNIGTLAAQAPTGNTFNLTATNTAQYAHQLHQLGLNQLQKRNVVKLHTALKEGFEPTYRLAYTHAAPYNALESQLKALKQLDKLVSYCGYLAARLAQTLPNQQSIGNVALVNPSTYFVNGAAPVKPTISQATTAQLNAINTYMAEQWRLYKEAFGRSLSSFQSLRNHLATDGNEGLLRNFHDLGFFGLEVKFVKFFTQDKYNRFAGNSTRIIRWGAFIKT